MLGHEEDDLETSLQKALDDPSGELSDEERALLLSTPLTEEDLEALEEFHHRD